METATVKEFAKEKGFVQVVPVVRKNTNGYPYMTFIDAENKAENIYFSKNASKLVTVGAVLDKGLASKLSIGYTKNAEGEVRIKLISNGERESIDALFD